MNTLETQQFDGKKYKDIMQLYQKHFSKREGEIAVYKTLNGWMLNERLVKIKKAYDKFVQFAVINSKGNELYNECCNYITLYNNEDEFVFV